MVTFTRFGATDVFLEAPVATARCGLISRGIQASAIDLSQAALTQVSIAFWGSLATLQTNQIEAYFGTLSTADATLPAGTGAMFFGPAMAAAGLWGRIDFRRGGGFEIINNTDAIVHLGADRSALSSSYRVSVRFAAGTSVVVRVDGSRILLQHPQPQSRFAFTKGQAASPTMRDDISIGLTGSAASRLAFSADVANERLLTQLQAVLRADFQIKPLGVYQPYARQFPLLRPHQPADGSPLHVINLAGDVDPFNIDQEGTGLLISAYDAKGHDGLIETHLVANHGDPVLLRPPPLAAVRSGVAKAARLVFSAQGGTGGPFARDYSLLPDGDFDVVLPPIGVGATERKSFGIVCGLSEREYMVIGDGQRLAFRAGRPAFASDLPANDGPLPAGVDNQFSSHTSTSWLAVLETDGTPATNVVAEDPEFSLYDPGDRAANLMALGNVALLHHAPLRLKPKAPARPMAAGSQLPALPIYPWKGATLTLDDPAALRRIETRVLTPNRRSLLQPDAVAIVNLDRAAATPQQRYTPLGLEMTVGVAGELESLLLAKVDALQLRLDGIAPDLADALLRADLFLVADRLDGLATLQAGVSIARWGFQADLPAAGGAIAQDGPVIIIKGRKGPLSALLDQKECWALPSRLCSSPSTMAARIRQLHRSRPPVVAGSDEDKVQAAAFAKIDAIFNDPEWTGVLIYNVKLDVGNLPEQITGLLGGAGSAIANLRAHHLGIDVRRLDPQIVAPTPLFGTLAYAAADETTSAPIVANNHYAFKLSRLVVGFDNGQVRHFLAKGLLTIQRLFDGTTRDAMSLRGRRRAAADPVVQIIGTFESRIEGGKPVDVYSFSAVLGPAGQMLLLPDGGLLHSITITKVTFATTAVERDSTGSKMNVTTRFTIDGGIAFNDWPQSLAIIKAGTAFTFTGLGIDFAFELDWHGGQMSLPDGGIRFGFQPGGLSFDFGKLPSLTSLLGKLPFRFRSFELWPSGLDLPKLGFTRLDAGRGGGSDAGNFGFIFDLDLGSLGALAQTLKDFKLSLLLGFGYPDGGSIPSFALGFRFEGSGGSGLDIGIDNVLKVKADTYDVGKHPSKDLFFAYALKARLEVMGHEFPKDAHLALFMFIDPSPQTRHLASGDEDVDTAKSSRRRLTQSPLTTIGWLGVMTNPGADASDIVSLDVLALGQRILLFPGQDGPGMTVHDYVGRIADEIGGENLPASVRDALDQHKIDVVTKELLSRIQYAPDRGWMVGLRAKVARVLDFDILFRDPDLYGIHINFKDLIDLDILYRKLSEDLGVYSVTLVPPASIRRMTIGVADVILPTVGLDFYTDGGFAGNLGYPFNRDFSHSAVVEVLPFVGAGGLRAGLLKGGGSTLVPAPVNPRYRYNPVIEVGLAFRVGLGKSFEEGPFRASISLTVYTYLEGAQGRLEDLHPALPAPDSRPADTFYVVHGAFGIMGEIIGAVDFGVIKARVEIVLYVEASVRVRTDDSVLLAFQAGVTVNIRIVIARFRVFGHTVEIAIDFSFSATVRYQTTLGSRRGDFASVYTDVGRQLRLAAAGWRSLTETEAAAWLAPSIAWACPPLAALELAQKQPLLLWFLPDICAAAAAGSDQAAPEAVFKLYLESELADATAASPYDSFAKGLTLWLLWAGLRDLRMDQATADDPLDWAIGPDELDLLMRKVTGPDSDPRGAKRRLPQYAELRTFFANCFAGQITRAPAPGGVAKKAVFFPLPEEVELLRTFPTRGISVVRLIDARFVDEAFEDEVEDQFAWLKALWDQSQPAPARIQAAAPKSLASMMFEEYCGYLLRACGQALQRATGKSQLRVADLLNLMQRQGAGSPLREAGASAGHFFNHGLALMRPAGPQWATIRTQVPPGLTAIGDADPEAPLPIFRFASLQLALIEPPLGGEAATSVGLRQAGAGPLWFTIAADVADIPVMGAQGTDPVAELGQAAAGLSSYASSIDYAAIVDRQRIVTQQPHLQSPAALRQLFDTTGTQREAYLLDLPPALVNDVGVQVKTVEVTLRQRDSNRSGTVGLVGDGDKPAPLDFKLGVAIPVRLRRVKGLPPDDWRTVFEIYGAREDERRLLDELSPDAASTALNAALEIAQVDLYAFLPASPGASPTKWVRMPARASVVQSNLSIDANPDATLRMAALQDEASSYQALQTEATQFVELFRRACIVNSGGFWMICDDITAGADAVELLMLVTLRNATTLRAANALVSAVAQPTLSATNRLGELMADDGNLVGVIQAGSEPRLLPRPGQLPIRVTIPSPSRGYHVAMDGRPRMMTFEELAEEANAARGPRAARLKAAVLASNADVQLRERFSLLEVMIADDGDFTPTAPGQILPVGVTDTADASKLSTAAPSVLNFVHTLPLQSHLRTSSLNPYAAVGKRLHLKFRLRDINGNSLPGPPRDASGELLGPIQVEYYDGLLSLAELPCLVASYEPGGAANVLSVRLEFSKDAFNGHLTHRRETARAAALATRASGVQQAYQTALWQAGGVGFTLSVDTSLAGGTSAVGGYDPAKPLRLPVNDLGPLTGFYSAVIAYVSAAARVGTSSGGRRHADQPAPSVTFDVPLGGATRAAFIEPSVELVLSRTSHVNTSIKDVPNASEARFGVSTSYELIATGPEREQAQRTFATNLANVVLSASHVAATGGPQTAGRPGASVWFIRADLMPRQVPAGGAKDPRFLGMPPLSNRPQTFDALVHPQLETGDVETSQTVRLVDIDLDVYGRVALQRLEELLSPRMVLRSTRLSQGRTLLNTVLAVKDKLADRLAARAIPILATQTLSDVELDEARSTLRSRLMARLTAAYEIDTLLSYQLDWPNALSVKGPRPAVYGRVATTTAQPGRSMPTDVLMVSVPDAGHSASSLALSYDAVDGESPLPVHSVDVGTFTVTHVQRLPRPDRSELLKRPSKERYRGTQWLRLLDPWVVTQLSKRQEVPIVRRQLPQRPTVTGQSFKAMPFAKPSAAAFRIWSFNATWSWQGAATDIPVAIVDYWRSEPVQTLVDNRRVLDPLGEELLRFALSTDLCWDRVTGSVPMSAALLDYLTRCVARLATRPVQLTARSTSGARDVVSFRYSQGAWRTASPILQAGHSVSNLTSVQNVAGSVWIDGIDIMQFSRAQFSMELYRNRDFQLSNGNPTPANEQFIYHLTGIAAGKAITPRLDQTAVLPSPLTGRARVADHVRRLFSDLFVGGYGQQSFDVHASLAPMALPQALALNGDWPGVALPGAIGLMSDRVKGWDTFAAEVETWLRSANLTRSDGYVQLALRVYRQTGGDTAELARGEAADTENQPVVRINRLRIPITNIDLSNNHQSETVGTIPLRRAE